MSFDAAERVARALLFEGYLLYPYRASGLKNQRRWAFGTLYPRGFCEAADAGDSSRTATECLVTGKEPRVRVVVKFLQLVSRVVVGPGAARFSEAVEQSIVTGELALPSLAEAPHRFGSTFAASRSVDDDHVERVHEELRAVVVVSAAPLAPSVWRLSVSVDNATDPAAAIREREHAALFALSSVHTLLGCAGGRFVSQTEPPEELGGLAASCRNQGAWPVLVGDPARADTVLSSPIILPDFPSVSVESPGDLFDATEIDEILSLRIRTLSDDERREVMRTDARARALLERTEALGEKELLALHGICALASPPDVSGAVPDGVNPYESLFARRPTQNASAFSPGDRVVLRPARGGDVFDLALAGQPATVLGMEEDVEGHVLYTVTVDADPGRDLGERGLPGHRFFFRAEELVRLP